MNYEFTFSFSLWLQLYIIRKGVSGGSLYILQPDFSEVPLNTEDDIAKWLNFYEMSAPLVCLGTFVTQVTVSDKNGDISLICHIRYDLV